MNILGIGMTLKYEEPLPCILAISKPQLVAIRGRGRLLPQFEKLTIDWWQQYRQIFNRRQQQ
jgi:hypothetical protein